MGKQMEERKKKAEESLQKKYHKQLFSPFARACKKYELIREGDHIAVCISGGKDSMLMAKLFQEIKRHRQMEFELTFLVMDPGYNRENREDEETASKRLEIKKLIAELKKTNPYIESNIFRSMENVNLDTVIEYKKGGVRHNFLDEY